MPHPPRNLLFITTDQQRFDTLGCLGNEFVKTPNLDRLAREGVRGLRHTCSSPTCTPARCSMLTGQYPRTHGVHECGYALPADRPGLATWLDDAGYRCGLFGKAHFEPATGPLDRKLDKNTPYYGFHEFHVSEDNQRGEYLQWVEENYPEHLEAVRDDGIGGPREGRGQDRGPGTLKDVYTGHAPEYVHQSTWLTNHAKAFMSSCANQNQPFFAWCSFVDPHHPFNPPAEYADMYDPDFLPDPPMREGDGAEIENGYWRQSDLDPAEYRRMKAAYYAMISHIDSKVCELLDTLEGAGVLDSTVIVFTSDHGDYLGDRGLIRKGWMLRDALLHVPLLLRLPNKANAGSVMNSPTQHEDLAPTFLELLGLDVPQSVQGLSFASALSGNDEPRRYSYYQNHAFFQKGDGAAGVREGKWKLVYYPHDCGYVLTDTENDPHEYDNLSGRDDLAAVEAGLKDALLRWLAETPNYRPPKQYHW